MDIKHIAKLANLTLTPEEEMEFDQQLSGIVGYIEKLNSINTENIEPTAQVTGLTNRTRPDDSTHECLTQEQALSGTKNTHNKMFKVGQLVDTTA